MKAALLVVGLVGIALYSANADARCVCRCVNGNVRPICESSLDLPPLCAPQICPLVPPSVAPIPKPVLPPLGTTSCREVQVYNPYTRQYEWRTICK